MNREASGQLRGKGRKRHAKGTRTKTEERKVQRNRHRSGKKHENCPPGPRKGKTNCLSYKIVRATQNEPKVRVIARNKNGPESRGW